jgi:hypothetical protein
MGLNRKVTIICRETKLILLASKFLMSVLTFSNESYEFGKSKINHQMSFTTEEWLTSTDSTRIADFFILQIVI